MLIEIGKAFKLGDEGIADKPGFENLGVIVSALIKNIYWIAGLILLFLLIFGGISFILQAGSKNPEGTSKAKNAITAALAGFIIIFASYWILQIIQEIIGINILNPNV